MRDSLFAMVVDGRYYATYAARAEKILPGIQAWRALREAKNRVRDARLLTLRGDAIVLTFLYRAEFVQQDGRRGYQDAAATHVFVRRGEGWKNAQCPSGPR